MSEIKRYAEVFGSDITEIKAHANGLYVLHADHLAVLAVEHAKTQDLGARLNKEAIERLGIANLLHDANNELMASRARIEELEEELLHLKQISGAVDDIYERSKEHMQKLESESHAVTAERDRMRAALQMLYPGLVLDLRYADDDDDKDAMRARIQTIEEALDQSAGKRGND